MKGPSLRSGCQHCCHPERSGGPFATSKEDEMRAEAQAMVKEIEESLELLRRRL